MSVSHHNRRPDCATPAAFLGNGRVAASIASRDWSATLGPIEQWSQALKTVTALLLRSPLPMILLWGDDGIFLYNDAYSVLAGDERSTLVGGKIHEHGTELDAFHAKAMQAGFAGRTVSHRDQEITLHRAGRNEHVFLDLDYWPVLDESGRPVSVLGCVTERTRSVLAERRTREAAERFRAFLVASTTTVYRMSPDWKEMRQLDGKGFLADTLAPLTEWLRSYIPADDQPIVNAKIDEAIRSKASSTWSTAYTSRTEA